MGISPDIIVLRTDEPIEDTGIIPKIAHFCNVKEDCVIENQTLTILYEAPLMLEKSGITDVALRKLNLESPEPDLGEWREVIEKIRGRSGRVKIGLVGKYIQLHDAYLSVVEALRHAGYEEGVYVDIEWIDSETVNAGNVADILGEVDGVIVPGGFGGRGIEGMILTAEYCRNNNVPYLGICLGMQITVIEAARNLLGLADANSGEFDPESSNKVIDFMPGQNDEINKGGTLRLGSYPCNLVAGTVIAGLYKTDAIAERHRHRYEYNNDYREQLEGAGLKISGLSPDGFLVETVENPSCDFYVGVQFHPEFKSRPNKPHPLFIGLVAAAKAKRS